jgi:hypothetical protein
MCEDQFSGNEGDDRHRKNNGYVHGVNRPGFAGGHLV